MAAGTPLWAGRCFTQTGQRSGGLIINSDQQRSEVFASGLRKWWIPPPLKSPSECLREASPGSQRLFIPASNGQSAGMFFSCLWQNFLPNVGKGDFPLPDTMSALLLNRLKNSSRGHGKSHANNYWALLAAVESIIYADPARRLSERCWSELMISPPERCPRLRETSHALCCVRHTI